MKTKIVPVFLSVLLLSTMVPSVAVAVAAEGKGNATSTAAKAAERGNATSTAARNDNATSTNEKNKNATSTGQLNAAEHRSIVATFVKSLLSVAYIEGNVEGIGPEVRVVAQSQNDSASTTADAITKVENRSALKTFLLGSDYKNLGQLRSEMVTTQNNINQLNNLITKAKYNMDKAELTAQIKALEDSQVKVDAFVTAQENKFSLFGWLIKPFVK